MDRHEEKPKQNTDNIQEISDAANDRQTDAKIQALLLRLLEQGALDAEKEEIYQEILMPSGISDMDLDPKKLTSFLQKLDEMQPVPTPDPQLAYARFRSQHLPQNLPSEAPLQTASKKARAKHSTVFFQRIIISAASVCLFLLVSAIIAHNSGIALFGFLPQPSEISGQSGETNKAALNAQNTTIPLTDATHPQNIPAGIEASKLQNIQTSTYGEYTQTVYQAQNSNYAVIDLEKQTDSMDQTENILIFAFGGNYYLLDQKLYDTQTGLPYETILPGNYDLDLQYSSENNLISGQLSYSVSPTGSWSLHEMTPLVLPGNDTARILREFLLKDNNSGHIYYAGLGGEDFGLNPPYAYYWLPDDTLLYCRADMATLENAIYILQPQTMQSTELARGTLLAYDAATNSITYLKNGYGSEKYLLNIESGEETDTGEALENFNYGAISNVRSLPTYAPLTLPDDLDIANLPQISPQIEIDYQQELHAAERVIPLPYAVYENAEATDPMMPLPILERNLGLTYEIDQEASSRSIRITSSTGNTLLDASGQKSLLLDNTGIRELADTVFVRVSRKNENDWGLNQYLIEARK